MNIYLNFVLEVLQSTEDGEAVADFDVLIKKPTSELVLSVSSLSTRIIEVIQPQNAGHHTRTIIDSEKVLVVLLDIINNCASNRNLGQEILIPQNEKHLAL